MTEPRYDSFVSYSSNDRERVEAIVELLGHELDKGFVDRQSIKRGDAFAAEIEKAIAGCQRLYLCWSANAAKSEWVPRELEWALKRWDELGGGSGFLHVIALDEEPYPPDVRDRVHAIRVTKLFGDAARVSTSRLPRVGKGLFGREDELAFLDKAWDEPGTHVVSLVAWGGVGKTALVSRWIHRRAKAGHPGAARVFCWSFYRQGTREDRQVSGDPFVAAVLRFFGHEGEAPKDPWGRGLLLAELLCAAPTLLVPDGLEPLQHPPGPSAGVLRDPTVQALLKELATQMRGDTLMTRLVVGLRRPRARYRVMGLELAGVVEQVGARVTRFRVGDRVFGFTGFSLGGYAQYCTLSERSPLARIPAGLSFEEAAATVDGATTALFFLRRKAGLRAGDRVLVIGASGSIGTAAVQIARHFGAEVTGVCSGRNRALVESLGAHDVLDYTREDFAATGRSWDIIFDTVSRSTFAHCRSALADGGRYLVTDGGPWKMLLSRLTRWFCRKKLVFGMSIGKQPELAQLTELLETGALRPVIDRRYSLEEMSLAQGYVDTGHKRGNVVIRVDHEQGATA